MGGVWVPEFSEQYLHQLKQLDPKLRPLFIGYMKLIVADPLSTHKNFRSLPPMHMPGTRSATFGDHIVHFFIERNDEDEAEGKIVRFLRIYTSRPGF